MLEKKIILVALTLFFSSCATGTLDNLGEKKITDTNLDSGLDSDSSINSSDSQNSTDTSIDSESQKSTDIINDSDTNIIDTSPSTDSTTDTSIKDTDTGTPPLIKTLFDEDAIAAAQSFVILPAGNNVKHIAYYDSTSGDAVMQVEIQDGADSDNDQTGATGYYFDEKQTAIDITGSAKLKLQALLYNQTCDFSIALVETASSISSYMPLASLTGAWKAYTFDLSKFTGVNLKYIRGLAFKGTNTDFCRVYLDEIEVY
ncbi:MAG: hypothetical protein JXR91_10055 [Deltaproteobacteria bacterium]|nr:hypothetical protein [Deltaproteobacteria bacterium]